ncbi:MAG: NAD(P)H-dependent oxidoreductase [Cellulosilyticaceae bacterium]
MNITLLYDTASATSYTLNFKNKLSQLLLVLPITPKFYELTLNSLHHCIGCFDCWLKTPGQCVINDPSISITQSVIASDFVIILTPITYGGYSAPTKQSLDRLLPLLSPFFTLKTGEMHHCKRYDHYPNLLVIGYGDELSIAEVETFKNLQHAMQKNFYMPQVFTCILQDSTESESILSEIRRIIHDYKEGALS